MLYPATIISAPTLDQNQERHFIVQEYESPLITEQVKREEPSDTVQCNCYLYVKSYYPKLPSMAEIINNVSDEVSDVAVMYYPNSGLYHVANVTWTDGYNFKITETNYSKCKVSQRNLSTDYPRLIGFYTVE